DHLHSRREHGSQFSQPTLPDDRHPKALNFSTNMLYEARKPLVLLPRQQLGSSRILKDILCEIVFRLLHLLEEIFSLQWQSNHECTFSGADWGPVGRTLLSCHHYRFPSDPCICPTPLP